MTTSLPSEFAINMNLEKMMILQQPELPFVNQLNYFDTKSPCHIYFICKRPRILIDPNKFEVTDEYFGFVFKIQNKNEFEELPLKFENEFGTKEIICKSEYPNNKFQLFANDEIIFDGKVAAFLQFIPRIYTNATFLDLEILYIGQSYGVDGARTAPDRLKNHSTLQGIYSEAISNNPDSEIWLALASFSQINIVVTDGRTKYSHEEWEKDEVRFKMVNDRLNWEGINEQQKINFTEAALIKYFQPPYNIVYKDTFPNPAHKTYSECYELDINAICIELNTLEMINCSMYSEKVEPAPWHMKYFLLNSEEKRKDMFKII